MRMDVDVDVDVDVVVENRARWKVRRWSGWSG